MLKNNSGPFQCALPDTTFSSRNFSWNCWILVQIAQLWIKEENLVVQSLSCVWLVVTPWTAARQAPLSCTISQSLLKLVSIESAMLLTISSSIASISSCLQSFPASVFQWVSSSHQVAKALKLQVQCQSFQWIFRVYFFREGLGGSPCSPRDSQDSSAPQFESLNSSALNSKIYIIRSYMWGCSQLNYYSINKPLI